MNLDPRDDMILHAISELERESEPEEHYYTSIGYWKNVMILLAEEILIKSWKV